MNVIDFVILGVLAVAVVCVIVWMIRRKKRCKGGCAGCPYSDNCQALRDEHRWPN